MLDLLWVAVDDNLYLANQDGVDGFYGEAAAQSRHASGPGQTCNNGWLFDNEGYDIVAVVDQKIQCDAHGQAKDADDVFDHLVSDVELYLMVAAAQQLHIVTAE